MINSKVYKLLFFFGPSHSLLIIILCLFFSLSGCTHLHNNANQAIARNASELLDNIHLATINATARANLDKLNKAEIDADSEFYEVQLRFNLFQVIDPEPSQNSDVKVGWDKLIRERDKHINNLNFKEEKKLIKDASAICSIPYHHKVRSNNYDELVTERDQILRQLDDFDPDMRSCNAILSSIKDKFKREIKYTNDCDIVFQENTSERTACSEICWELVQELSENDKEIMKLSRPDTTPGIKKLSARSSNYKDQFGEYSKLYTEWKISEKHEKDLQKTYQKAKNAYEEAVIKFEQQEKGNEAGNVSSGDDALKESKDTLQLALKAAQKLPLIDSIINQDFLSGILENRAFLASEEVSNSGEDTNARARNIDNLWKIYTAVSKDAPRLVTERPSINTLRLELAFQHLRFKIHSTERSYETKKLWIMEDNLRQIELEESMWIQIARATDSRFNKVNCLENLINKSGFSAGLKSRLKNDSVATVFEKSKRLQRRAIAQTLLTYTGAKSAAYRQKQLDRLQIQIGQTHEVDMSEISIMAWNELISAPVAELVQYHEGGVTTEEIAALITAIGMAAIAGGVY